MDGRRRDRGVGGNATIWLVVCTIGVLTFSTLAPRNLPAQQRELTTEDRVAMLYAPQLDFTERGDPLIRVGLMEGRERVTFRPSQAIRVMPRGDAGPEMVLPGDREYTVTVGDSQEGTYRHWVVVDELTMNQRDRVESVKKEWMKRNYAPKTFQVGGLFGIQGSVFDSRVILVGIGGTEDYEKATDLREKVEAEYGTNARIHSELVEHSTGRMTLTAQGLDVAISHRDVMWIAAAEESKAGAIEYEVDEVRAGRSGGTETRTYGRRLIVAPDRDGEITLVNKISAERLLRGTVPSETYPSAPDAALRAQAIAARNTIFAAIGVRNLADPFMLRADVYDQVYKGLEAETESTNRAVEATRGEVMFFDGQIIEAAYSANAGGFTESNENVWNTEARPYLRGRPDAPMEEVPEKFRDGISEDELSDFLDGGFDAHAEEAPLGPTHLYRWSTEVDASTAVEWLDEHGRDFEAITGAEVTSRGVSGRAIRLELTAEGGASTKVERELNIRRLFGNLKSGLFEMTLQKDDDGVVETFEFRGAGYGHGVGMCQTGAMGMAAEGASYEKILSHYYEGIELKTLY